MSIHIESKKEDIASIVLMPGDPKRCEYIANKFLSNAKLVNTVRGMSAYTGYYKNKKVTIFPSGMGIPSMGIYSYELFNDYDVKNIIRIGTMGCYCNLNLKDIVLVETSVTDSNYGKTICDYNDNKINGSNNLNNLIEEVAKNNDIKINKGNIFCSEVFYEKENTYLDKVNLYNVLGVEMESFSLFMNAKLLNKQASTILMVTDNFLSGERLSSDEREKGLDKMITLALDASLKL